MPEQDDIRRQLGGFGKGLVEVSETVGLALVVKDKLERRSDDLVALDHENAIGIDGVGGFETLAHGILTGLIQIIKQTPYRDG